MAHQFYAAEEFADLDHANLAGPLLQRTYTRVFKTKKVHIQL